MEARAAERRERAVRVESIARDLEVKTLGYDASVDVDEIPAELLADVLGQVLADLRSVIERVADVDRALEVVTDG